MKQIRRNIFETNSSSTHSVSVIAGRDLEKNRMTIDADGYIHAELGRFGWDEETYTDQDEKLSYLLTMVYMKIDNDREFSRWDENYSEEGDVKRTMKSKDFRMVSDEIARYAHCKGVVLDRIGEGYIDHQSHECYRTTSDFLDDYGLSVIEFVYGRGVSLHTDNDNH